MTPPIAFDPSALLCGVGEDDLVEATLDRLANRWVLTIERDNGDVLTLHLREDFFAEVIAQARAREADAA